MSYTKAKWTVNGTDTHGRQRICKEEYDGSKGWNIAIVLPSATANLQEDEANARLIAACPDMVEALKRLAEWPLHSECADGSQAKNAAESLANARRFAATISQQPTGKEGV